MGMFEMLFLLFHLLGFMGSIFQSIINNAPNLVFDSMKPFMLKVSVRFVFSILCISSDKLTVALIEF